MDLQMATVIVAWVAVAVALWNVWMLRRVVKRDEETIRILHKTNELLRQQLGRDEGRIP